MKHDIVTLEELKYRIAEFSDSKFGVDRPYTAPLHHLKEEVDETIESGELEEYADMLLLMLDSYRKKYPYCSTQRLLNECESKLEVLKSRTWNKPDENGVYHHVKNDEYKSIDAVAELCRILEEEVNKVSKPINLDAEFNKILREKTDIIKFINTECDNQHPLHGINKMKLYRFQEKILRELEENKFTWIKSSRQMGLSTILSFYSLHNLVNCNNTDIYYYTDKQAQAEHIVTKFRMNRHLINGLYFSAKRIDNFETNSTIYFRNTYYNDNVEITENSKRKTIIIYDTCDCVSHLLRTIEKYKHRDDIKIIVANTGKINSLGILFDKYVINEKLFDFISVPWYLHPDRNIDWYDCQKRTLGNSVIDECLNI